MNALPCGLESNHGRPTFFDYYCHGAGQSIVPPVYHLWCALALVAAALADRVWIERRNRPRLCPNLFVMLIGTSGTGKDTAIERATTLVTSLHDVEQDRIRIFEGKITAQALISHFSEESQFVWLVTPELRMQVGEGQKAKDFVSHMTELYKTNFAFKDRTRTSGYFEIDKFCLNWVSGTTPDWLVQSIGQEAIYSGFFARICAIPQNPIAKPPTEPIYPDDADFCDEQVRQYLTHLAYFMGPMTISPSAAMYRNNWFQNRIDQPYTEEIIRNFVRHSDTIALKLAMCFAAGDNFSPVIHLSHMKNAIKLVDWCAEHLHEVMNWTVSVESKMEREFIQRWFQEHGTEWVAHSAALKAASNKGIKRDKFKELITLLTEQQDLEVSQQPGSKGRWYRWIK